MQSGSVSETLPRFIKGDHTNGSTKVLQTEDHKSPLLQTWRICEPSAIPQGQQARGLFLFYEDGLNTMIEWIDTNGCAQSYHSFTRDDEGRIVCLHASGEECEVTEYKGATNNETKRHQ